VAVCVLGSSASGVGSQPTLEGADGLRDGDTLIRAPVPSAVPSQRKREEAASAGALVVLNVVTATRHPADLLDS
jgi:hypothetical protein